MKRMCQPTSRSEDRIREREKQEHERKIREVKEQEG